MADIFISYTSTDRDWAFWIANELRDLGHTPHVHEFEVKAGDDIYAWMEHHHDAADHVLCVVSDEYLKAPYSTLERNAALWQAASKRPGFVLLVAVKPCRFPTLTDHLRRCELYGVSDDEKRKRFREFMSKRGVPGSIALPGAYAVSNVPIRVPTLFMGRDDALAAIEAALKRYEGRVAITALHGLRGVGKTTLAAAYAERHRGEYRTTWWIRAQTEPTMRADLVGLGVRLKWVAADENEEPALTAVTERLQQEGEGILLVYDNAVDADTLRPYLPRGGRAHVLVTSNAHAWRGLAEPVELRLWPKDIGADYLIARTGRQSEREAALDLSETLGGLPLAHEQAAAYCERLDISLAEYAKRFEATPARLLDDARHAPAEYHDGLTVAKTFALAIEEAAKLHPAAEPLIVHAALLAPEPIPLFLFSEARKKFGEPLASALDGDGLDEAVAALRAFALVDRETIADERDPSITTDCIRLHRLVAQVASVAQFHAPHLELQRLLIEALAAVYPSGVYDDPGCWPRARRLDRFALALVGEKTPEGLERDAAHLLDGLASYQQWALGKYDEARPLFERALAAREKALGPEHPEIPTSLQKLAYLLEVQDEFPKAKSLFERALAIDLKLFGPDHPDTAISLGFLATLLLDQDDIPGARALYQRALAIRERLRDYDHPHVGTLLNNLALLELDEGNVEEALKLFKRALSIREQSLGLEHTDTAETVGNLAYTLSRLGDVDEAKRLYSCALKINEKVLGPEHPDTATSLNNLARLLSRIGSSNEAEPLFQRAIAIGEKARGPAHPLTQRYRSHLARLLLDTGRVAEALGNAEAALAVHASSNGPNHPWTKDSARVTADALDALGRTEEANAVRERYGIEKVKDEQPKPL